MHARALVSQVVSLAARVVILKTHVATQESYCRMVFVSFVRMVSFPTALEHVAVHVEDVTTTTRVVTVE